MKYRTITKCRICGSENLAHVLNLGQHPLANSLKRNYDQTEDRFPLNLLFCTNCSLVQLKETVEKEILFSNYIWVTGTSSAAKQYAKVFYNNIISNVKLKKDDLVVEIASNDGTYLKPFIENGFNAVGIDPAKNIAELANKNGVKTINAFWDAEEAKRIVSELGNAKVIIARNVIPHVSNLNEVMFAMNQLMDRDGIGAIEFHYAGNILKELQYDSIYHEHLCYFSIKTIKYLLNNFDLLPFHIEISPISGGAYVVFFSKNNQEKSATFNQLLNLESSLFVNDKETWDMFANKCIEHKNISRDILKSFYNMNVVGFGASARSSTYLNFCGFTDFDIKAIIDNNNFKQGLYSAGSSIPILSIEKGLNIKPEIIFVLAWNFKEEIIKECERNGYAGKYLIPFPNKPYIINKY